MLSIFYTATESSQQLTDRSHVISGPMGEGAGGRRNRANQSILATAFQNAWKQGNLAAEVRQTELNSIFDRRSVGCLFCVQLASP